MASGPESFEQQNAETKSDPPVLSECIEEQRISRNDQEIENSTAPHLSPVNAVEADAVEESVSDPTSGIEHAVDEEQRSPKFVSRLRSTNAKRKKARSQKDVDGCSVSSESASRRTRKSDRNPVLITLSSDSNSDSEAKEKMSCSENEEPKAVADPPADAPSKKRVAHVNAELIRKFSSFGWHRKEQDYKASDSSNNSADNKEKKNVKRKKQKTLASRAALMKRKYFKANTLRRSCVAAQNRILSPLKRGMKGRRLRSRKTVYQNPYPTFLPKHRERQVMRPLGSKRGRPKKIFPSPASSQNSSNHNNNDGNRRSEDEDKEDYLSEPCASQSCPVGTESDRKIPPGQSAVMIPKRARGRPRLSDKERESRLIKEKESRLKKKKHPSTIINRKIKPVLQNESCFDLAAKLPKCRECRLASYYKKKNQQSYCRFFEYRKLCFAKNGNILNAGFSLATDATLEDMRLWLPKPCSPPMDLTIETSKALLVQVGDQFCDLIEQEREALSLHIGSDKMVTWKRIVQGVREMCDVCDTTLFNIHWVCPKCGLAVCIDCYKVRKQGIVVENEESKSKGMDEYMWLLCNGRQPHEQEKLIMAQIVPGNALWTMRDAMHRARDMWNIAAYCRCRPQEISNKTKKVVPTGICKELMCHVSRSFSAHPNHSEMAVRNFDPDQKNYPKTDVELDDSAMQWLTGVDDNADSIPECDPCYESFASLKNMLTQGNPDEDDELLSASTYTSFALDDIIACVIEAKTEKSKGKSEKDTIKLFNHRYPQPNSGRDPLPIRIFTTTESSMVYPDVPHSWLCNGRLLLLHQPQHPKNLELFQEQWKRGQPIMVMGVDKRLDMSLWHPDGFCRDFGEVKNDLVNCRTGAIIPDLPMKKFWEGFENFEKRMRDESGEYMLLKLKDWPPGEDFSEKLPTRFQDLMKGLPLPEYTHRDGIFNLAGRLPHWFVRPDLGPKMYNAYGSALYPTKGTTNLHLDVSDAVNVMVYVGVPHDGKDEDHIQEALKAIDEGGCDSLMRERVRSRGVRPGALWHIYNARDADKIRDLLTKVAIERGEKLEAQHDPIHDQSWYIDTELRKRLYHEYGVEGYAIAQCLGDAVFIPAGAPHQVRNLHSCVKVAEDFVSPENIAHCFKLTQEFRHLSDTHTNHEDKLQIKNIIYHVVKDALSHLIDPEAAQMYQLINL